MSTNNHIFRFRLPNGAEAHLEGDKDFVTQGYNDIRNAAVQLLNREVGRVLSEVLQLPVILSSEKELPPVADARNSSNSPVPPAQNSSLGSRKPRVAAKADPSKVEAKQTRETLLKQFIEAKEFPDLDRFSVALNTKSVGPRDLTALITRLGQAQFGFDMGMSPSEVHYVLENRFFIKRSKTAVKDALGNAPADFYSQSPAPFDDRSKLYRPMKGCMEHVEKLLAAANQGAQTVNNHQTASSIPAEAAA